MATQPISNNKLTPVDFQKIKNRLLNDYSATEPGRFTYYLAQDQEHFWKLISEKYPISKTLQLHAVDKANVVWERISLEPSPRRFIDLCQAVVDHIFFIQSLPSTESRAPMYFGYGMHDAFLREVWAAFNHHGHSDLLKFEEDPYEPGQDRSVEYIGNDFGKNESEMFIANTFESATINTALAIQLQQPSKKRWSLSRLSPKLKLPGFEIGAEVDRK